MQARDGVTVGSQNTQGMRDNASNEAGGEEPQTATEKEEPCELEW